MGDTWGCGALRRDALRPDWSQSPSLVRGFVVSGFARRIETRSAETIGLGSREPGPACGTHQEFHPATGSAILMAGRRICVSVSAPVRKCPKTTGLKLPVFLLSLGPFFGSTRAASILPPRPPKLAAAARRACQGWPRLSRPPAGLGLDGPEHGGMLIGSGLEALATS